MDLKISSAIVGLRLKPFETSVSWRQTTNYAAALGDMNPHYFDDLREEGIIAPPMFAVALSWPVIQNLQEHLDLPYPPTLFRTMVHYSEHLEFSRLVRPGDLLTVTGEVAAVLPHKAGTFIGLKLSATDEGGRLVHIEHMGGLIRGIECADEGKGQHNIPLVPHPRAEGKPCWEVIIPISREAPYVYDGCSNIVFPIHTSPRFAKAVGLPDIILQGTATMGYAVREIINREADGNPNRLRVVSGRFTGMVIPGSEIRVQLVERSQEQDGSISLFFRVLNHNGKEAVSQGYVQLKPVPY